jgi:hypothetical protein
MGEIDYVGGFEVTWGTNSGRALIYIIYNRRRLYIKGEVYGSSHTVASILA